MRAFGLRTLTVVDRGFVCRGVADGCDHSAGGERLVRAAAGEPIALEPRFALEQFTPFCVFTRQKVVPKLVCSHKHRIPSQK